MKSMLEGCKNLTYTNTTVRIMSALNEESTAQIDALAAELAAAPAAELPEDTPAAEQKAVKKWTCKICGYIYEGDELPADFECPLCRRGAEDFELIS